MSKTSEDSGDLRATSALVGDLLAGRAADARRRLERGEPTPADLPRIADRQSLGWFLVEHLDASGLRDVLPDDVVTPLEENARRRQAMRDRQVAGLPEILAALESAGATPVLLKGHHLRSRFPRVAARTFLDSDVLVPRARAEDAERALVALGFELASRPLVTAALSRRFAHGFDFVRGDQRVDLHWSLASHWSYAIDEAGHWRRCRDLALPGGGTARVLADEDVLHELLVSFFEDLDRGGGRLRSAVDVEAVLAEVDATLDWGSFWHARAIDRTAGPCASALGVVLSSTAARDRFPGAARSVEAARPRAAVDAREGAILLGCSKGLRHNKRWAMDRYDCPRWKHAAWWLASLPFRISIYGRRPAPATSPARTGFPAA
ncbi:MAG: nucleotidyltransferase family protein [Alphaproteobacteria bacterium]